MNCLSSLRWRRRNSVPRTARNTSSSVSGRSDLGAGGNQKSPPDFDRNISKTCFMIFYYNLSPSRFSILPTALSSDLLREKMEEYKKNVAQAKPRQSLAWASLGCLGQNLGGPPGVPGNQPSRQNISQSMKYNAT